MSNYFELCEQKRLLTDLSHSGVVAARARLVSVNTEIHACESNPNIFEPSFIHKKPGFNKKLVSSLVNQARAGSDTCALELQKYSDWVICKMAGLDD